MHEVMNMEQSTSTSTFHWKLFFSLAKLSSGVIPRYKTLRNVYLAQQFLMLLYDGLQFAPKLQRQLDYLLFQNVPQSKGVENLSQSKAKHVNDFRLC